MVDGVAVTVTAKTSIQVELCYCAEQQIYRQTLQVEANADMQQIIRDSGLLEKFAELQQQELQFGVFGKLKSGNYVPYDGDRIELYRPLKVDPMEARRRRVTKKTKRNTKTF